MYRAPFDALITYMTVFVLPDTKTFWIFGTQHFITFQFSCLLLYGANPRITFEIQLREEEVPQESKCKLHISEISHIRESNG